MYFFDNDFLGQYLDQDAELKVFVDGEYYTIAGHDDLDNPTYGVGYDVNGKPHTFDYRGIEQIKAAGQILTRDQLQSQISGEDPEAGGEEVPAEAPGGEGGAEMPDLGEPAPPEGGGEGEQAPEEEEPEPPQESARRLVGAMLTEAKKNKKEAEELCGLRKGDLVQNTDTTCEFVGSRGTITNIDVPEGGGSIPSVEYRIFNYGYNFKPGQKVVKLANTLQKIGEDE